MSIDAPNAQMPVDKEVPNNFNYIDTYVEYIAEIILRYDNAIPESKDRPQKELQQNKQFEVVFQINAFLITPFFKEKTKKQFLNFSDKYGYLFFKEINPPPPKT